MGLGGWKRTVPGPISGQAQAYGAAMVEIKEGISSGMCIFREEGLDLRLPVFLSLANCQKGG
jgi:hypothetical protein